MATCFKCFFFCLFFYLHQGCCVNCFFYQITFFIEQRFQYCSAIFSVSWRHFTSHPRGFSGNERWNISKKLKHSSCLRFIPIFRSIDTNTSFSLSLFLTASCHTPLVVPLGLPPLTPPTMVKGDPSGNMLWRFPFPAVICWVVGLSAGSYKNYLTDFYRTWLDAESWSRIECPMNDFLNRD